MGWRPGAEEDRFDVERLEGMAWCQCAFDELQPGDLVRFRWGDEAVNPENGQPCSPDVVHVIAGQPFRNPAGVGKQIVCDSFDSLDHFRKAAN